MMGLSKLSQRQLTVIALVFALAFGCLILSTIKSCSNTTTDQFVLYCTAEQFTTPNILGVGHQLAILPIQVSLALLIVSLLFHKKIFSSKLSATILARVKWIHPSLPHSWPPKHSYLSCLRTINDH